MISAKQMSRIEKKTMDRITIKYEDWLTRLSRDELLEYEVLLNRRFIEVGLPSQPSPSGEDMSEEECQAYKREARELTWKVALAGRLGQMNAVAIEEWRAYETAGHPTSASPNHRWNAR